MKRHQQRALRLERRVALFRHQRRRKKRDAAVEHRRAERGEMGVAHRPHLFREPEERAARVHPRHAAHAGVHPHDIGDRHLAQRLPVAGLELLTHRGDGVLQRVGRHLRIVVERRPDRGQRGAEEFEHVAGDELTVVVDADHVVAVLEHHHPRAIAADAAHDEVGRAQARQLVFAGVHDQGLAAARGEVRS